MRSSDVPPVPAPLTLADHEIEKTTVGRRSALVGIGAWSAALATVGVAMHAEAQPGACTDHDPYDRPGHGRHCAPVSCSDSDPYDPAGHGRHCGGWPR